MRVVSRATGAAPLAAEYTIRLPEGVPPDAILDAIAAETRLERRGAVLRRSGRREPGKAEAGEPEASEPEASEPPSNEPVRIAVERPQEAGQPGTAPEFRVPFTIAVGAADPMSCVVRIRLTGDDHHTWVYAAEGHERCWPRPGAGERSG